MNRRNAGWPSSLTATLVLAAALGLAVASATPAAEPPGAGNNPGNSAFSIHDLDRNGVLSRQEYHQFLEALEQRRRVTGKPGRGYPPPLRFEEIDRNRDGNLSEDEMISALNQRLERHQRQRNRGGRW